MHRITQVTVVYYTVLCKYNRDYFSRHIIAKHKQFDGYGVTGEPPPLVAIKKEPPEKPPTTECKAYLAKHQGGNSMIVMIMGVLEMLVMTTCIDVVLGK